MNEDKNEAERFNLDLVLAIAEETVRHDGILTEEAGIVTVRFKDGSFVDFTRPMAFPGGPPSHPRRQEDIP